MSTQRTHLLVVLDGWGLSPIREGNSVSLASTPNFDRYWKRFPHAQLEAFGPAVGLPDGQMGGSEVGHLNIGAGRVVRQDMSEIDSRIESGSFYDNPAIEAAMDSAAERKSCLHLMGLLSDGGVHSSQTHLYALLDMANRKGLRNVQVHGFLDGRDVAPQSALAFVKEAETVMGNMGVGRFATISGRYYPMDRDGNWDRVERAYKAIVKREGARAASATQAVSSSYDASITDEFLEPFVIDGQENQGVEDGDSVIHFNFRSDRAKQLTRAFTEQAFTGFERGPAPATHYVCFKKYDDDISAPVAFGKPLLTNTMAEFLSQDGRRQLHVAESEKFNHVTFFFNGERMKPFPGEDRITVPSPDVGTYDKKPEMSAPEITALLKDALKRREHDFVVLNLANCDMVGHSGMIPETTRAVECVDTCLGEIVDLTLEQDGMAIITADHGNAEQMIDTESDAPWTAHTLNPVPFIMADPQFKGTLREYGALCDIIPTMMQVMGLTKPEEMDAKSMIANAGAGSALQQRFLGG